MEHWTDNAVNLLSLNIYNQCVNPNANFFLIGVINDQTRVATYRISSPSPKNQRAMTFAVRTYSSGFADLIANSFYNIVVYEQTNNTNLDPTNAVVLGLRWQGTMIVDGTSEVTYTQYPNPVTQNYVYFKE
tara:strand:+ start:986 stop:1378 length:393 start_codon:yes stop_codon:yes gene_type:complete